MIHLHLHTDASFLDGMITVEELVNLTKERGLPAVAITDHGTMSNIIKFYKYATEQGIKPIIGVEAYIEDGAKNSHMVLLAKDYKGFVKLNSVMFKAWHNFYRKPRIKQEWLPELAGHVIVTGACLAGWVNKDLMNDSYERVKYLKDIFGDDFYLEVQENSIPEQAILNQKVFEASKKFDIKVVATSDAHYLRQEDYEAHKVLLGIANFKSYGDYKDAWLKPREAYKHLPDEVFKNTFEVAEKCNVKLDFSTKMPKYSEDEKQEFIELVWSKFKKRVPDTEEYKKRTEYELSVIQKMGFEGYFMLLWDVIKYAKQNNIPVGPGRGCLAKNSMVRCLSGYKKLKDVKIGDWVLNDLGEWDIVINKMEYNCDEDLLKITTWRNTHIIPEMTSDHKVLVIKDPFKRNHQNWVKGGSKIKKLKHLKIDNAEWIKAENIKINDYLVRPIPQRQIKDVKVIDLALYVGRNTIYDNEYIYEKRPINFRHPLAIRTIHNETGLSRDFLKRLKKNGKNKLYKSNPDKIQKLKKYLSSYKYDISDFLAFDPYLKSKIKRHLIINDDFLFILGYFIGDGWLRDTHKAVGFAGNHTTKKYCINLLEKYFKDYQTSTVSHKNKNLIQFIVYSEVFYNFFKDMFPASGPQYKVIPSWAYSLPSNKLSKLIDGLLAADGHKRRSGSMKFTSTSLNLIYQVRDFYEEIGYSTSIQKREPNGDKIKTISYTVNINKNDSKNLNVYNDGKYLYVKVRKIEKIKNEDGKVYDITVKNRHCYSTDNYVVHNSASGSLLAYIIGITDIDPIPNGLIFERFLNPSRVSLPDIDVDFGRDKRDMVFNYVKNKYGEEHVAKIMTFGKFGPKMAFKDVARVKQIPYNIANEISKTIPGDVSTIAEAKEASSEFRHFCEEHPDIEKLCDRLIGVNRHSGIHAAGVIISPVPILEVAPMQWDKTNGPYVAVDKDDAEMAGLVKYDFLGLQTLTIIKKTGIDVNNIDLNDQETLSVFREGDTNGVFQFESSGMRKLLIDMQPTKFEDIVAANALYRPGPLENGLVDQYIENKKHPESIEYPFPELEEVLKETYGIICYQEQVMKISQIIAGFTMAEADTLRKAVAKKKAKLMAEIKKKFFKGAQKLGYDMDKVEKLFATIEKFARYSFNKSHSAAYAKLAMQTAYLKKHHLAKFLASAIAVEASDSKKVYEYIIEAKRHGIKILPPDINISGKDAEAISDNVIMLGLNNLKGFGESAIQDIVDNRPFMDPIDLIMRTNKVNKTMVKKLIGIGCFDFLGFRREDMYLTVEKFNKTKAKKSFSAFLVNEPLQFNPIEAGFSWTKQDLAQMEYDTFGFFLFENPIASYKDLMVYSNYDEIVFVEKVKKTKTRKRGEEMAIVKITDFNTYKEVPLFPRVWSKCPCKEGDVVMIKYSDGYPAEVIKAEDAQYEFRYMIITANNVPVDDILRVLNKYPAGTIITDIRDYDVAGPKVAFNMQLVEELKSMGCDVKFDK